MIDFHTHPVMIRELIEKDPQLENAVQNVYGFLFPPQPLKVFLLELTASEVDKAVLLPIDCTTTHGCKIVSNEDVAELANKYNSFIGFASVDPHNPNSLKDLEKAIKSLGLKGLNLEPALQRFDIIDKNIAYPLYQSCVSLNIPILIHCGISWSPIGLEKFANPLSIEEIAIDFPELKIIIPQFGWPWYNETIMLAMKYKNIYIDTSIVLSGTPSELLKHFIENTIGIPLLNRSLFNQVLFGSNYPRASIHSTVKGFKSLNLPKDLYNAISHQNAIRLLGTKE